MLRTAVLSGVAALVIAVNWLRFEEPRAAGDRPFLLAVLAIAPVLLRPLWPRLVAMYSDYEDYQSWTDRTIPVVICEPA